MRINKNNIRINKINKYHKKNTLINSYNKNIQQLIKSQQQHTVYINCHVAVTLQTNTLTLLVVPKDDQSSTIPILEDYEINHLACL